MSPLLQASILNLAAISLDRYVHIKDPLRYGRWVNKRSILGVIAVVWILAALISFVPISLGLHRADKPEEPPDMGEAEQPSCALDLSPTYAVVSSCVSFYLPCLVMVGIYCRLYLYARKHVKNIKAVTRPPPRCGDSRPSAPQPSSSYQVSDHKAAVTVGVIMGVFLVCWVPFFCANIIAAYCKTCIPMSLFKILTWLGYSNSAFNPIIYSIFNSEFRAAFHRILTSRLPPCCSQLSCCSCQLISCCRRCGYQAVALIQRRRSDPEVSSLHQMNGICTFRDTPRSSGGSIPGTFTRSTTPREIRCGSGSGTFGEKVSAI
ncbi:unnamed protein product [Orchesella dallaii]|uniref:G-protein coupled receptors family 1 profile domain-containing protein n=1 Tax=Orchesella dallaii TaxID=48710 RepID=A0ABP1PYC1_9HEXA